MSLSSEAMLALESKGKLQETVREICDRHAPTDSGQIIANEVSKFRADAADWIDKGDVQARRKQVNNVINDISRICRELIGKSIVCVSRKGGHRYEAQEPKARAPATPTPTITVHGAPTTTKRSGSEIYREICDLNDSSKESILTALIHTNEVKAMEIFLKMGKDHFVELVTKAKKNIDALPE